YGGGMDVLFDFITTYTNKSKTIPLKKFLLPLLGCLGG
ncbi:outer membrane HomC domain protein, partial [Helicobacter pylori R036d]